DDQHYYRRRGWSVSGQHTFGRFDLAAGYRDMRESPLDPTATWNLFDRRLSTYGNLAAADGRVREVGLAGGVALGRVPGRGEAGQEGRQQMAAHDLGSDFDYRRTRVAASGEFPLGRAFALVPQASWGKLTRDDVPQAAFYLGGTPTLRSLASSSLGGTGM